MSTTEKGTIDESLKQDLENAKKEVDCMIKSAGETDNQLIRETKAALENATNKVHHDLENLKKGHKLEFGKSQSESALRHVNDLIASFKSKMKVTGKEAVPTAKSTELGTPVAVDVVKAPDVEVTVKPDDSRKGVVGEIQETIQGVKELMEDSLEEGKKKGGEVYEAVKEKVLAGVDTIKGIATATKESATEAAVVGVQKGTEKAKDAVESGKEVAEQGVETGKGLLSSLASTVKDQVGFGVEKAKETAESAKETASQATDVAKEKAKEGIEYTKEKASSGVETLKSTAEDAKEKAKHGVEKAKEKAESTAREARGQLHKGGEKLKTGAESVKHEVEKGKAKPKKQQKGMKEKLMELMGKTEPKEEQIANKSKVKVEVNAADPVPAVKKEGDVSKLTEQMEGTHIVDTAESRRRADAAHGKHGR